MAIGNTALMLEEARAEVAQADGKSSTVLATLGIGFSAIFGGLVAGDWTPTHLHGAIGAFWWVGAALAILAVVSAAASIWPRYPRSKTPADLYYWGHVSRYKSLDAFLSALIKSTTSQERRIEHQLWHVSRLVHRKYYLVRLALILAASASFTLLLVGIASL